MSVLPAFPFPTDHALRPSSRLTEARTGHAPVRVQPGYGDPAWLVTRYEDARFVLSSPAFGRDHERAGIPPDRIARVTPLHVASGTFAEQDPPEHTRLRRFVYRTFTPRRVEDLRPGTQRIADRLVDDMIEQGPPLDLFEWFGLILPVEVICDLLGVPSSDRTRFTDWSDDLLNYAGTAERATASVEAMNAYLGELAAHRRRHPTDDLIGALVSARVEGDNLTDDEVNNLVRILLGAGHETTASQIPNFIFLLLDGGGYARLSAEPELVPTAVEELLRYVPLITQGTFARFVLEDVEVGGTLLHPGDQVLVEPAAANRDPAAFDDPETLDLARKDNPHLAFGHGLHRCVGAALARMELQIALATLTGRLPGLRLARPADQVPWHIDRFVRRPKELQVTW
ncbi:cytochrome P450 [Actinomadura rubrisoli]|uniref:Cytochrome P450 n=1 Tax=Actinomadura rubrisoli TaxID=2530368 RepID=A0A4R5C4P9_9ACTN|nr:cytochrome P450 [Actinomadura rubrisoli]TDD93945.1 cytochrome P450 [Actinomadura rubrisoli]